MILADECSAYQYLIVETDSAYYSLTLVDLETNIRYQNKEEMVPVMLKFNSLYKLSIQNYNSEPVLTALSENVVEIYHLQDLDNSMFSVDLKYVEEVIVEVLLFERLMFILTLQDMKMMIRAISLVKLISCSGLHNEEAKLWCNQNYDLLTDPFLYRAEISCEKLVTISSSSSTTHRQAEVITPDIFQLKKKRDTAKPVKSQVDNIFDVCSSSGVYSVALKTILLQSQAVLELISNIQMEYTVRLYCSF